MLVAGLTAVTHDEIRPKFLAGAALHGDGRDLAATAKAGQPHHSFACARGPSPISLGC